MKPLSKLIFVQCLYITFFIGCNAHNDKSNPEIKTSDQQSPPFHINLPEKSEGILTASNFLDRIEYIPLETNNNSLLKRIDKVVLTDSFIAISDFRHLILFNRQGKYLRKIGQRGKGPGEHQYIYNIFFKHDTIGIVSSRKVIYFSTKGQFIKEAPITSVAYSKLTPSGNISIYNQNTGAVLFLNSAFEITDTLIMEPNVSVKRHYWMQKSPYKTYFQTCKKSLLFYTYLSDTVWNITNGKKKAEYILNLKDRLLPYKKQVEFFEGDFKRYLKSARPYVQVNFIQASNFMLIPENSYGHDSLTAIYLHDFKKQETHKYHADNIEDDLTAKMKLPVFRKIMLSTDGQFITSIDAYEIIDILENTNQNKATTDEKHLKWKTKMSKVNFDDNPILILMNPM